ncbi:MAG: DUF5717 family protein [Lachnospiraceae bacterium]
MDNRAKHQLLAEYLKTYEDYQFKKIDSGQYAARNLAVAERLIEMVPEEPDFQLMKASVLIEADKKDEAEGLLKKYEKNHILQLKNPEFRAAFLYLAGRLSDDPAQKRQVVGQLQKLYRKNPKQQSLFFYLARSDEGFEKNPQKKLALLEKQWNLGNHQNLLYIETVLTLRKYPEAAAQMNGFFIQVYIWAVRRRVITKEMGSQIAKTAMHLKSCDAKYEYLLRRSYEYFSTKELLAALCSLYIRSCRTDSKAARYYAKGVEFELKLVNLHEYYMMATVEESDCLLPEQVLLYFIYHNTLSASQKVYLYKNIVCYGDKESEIYQKYREQIEKYTLESLLKEKISPEYAYLYDHVLYPEIFTEEMAEAMSKILFLRKIECHDKRVRAVEVSYEQMKQTIRYPLRKGTAYIPIYTPNAKVTLVDESGNLYRNTIAYELKKMLDVKRYVDVCKENVRRNPGLLLYLCEGRGGKHLLNEDTIRYFYQIPDTKEFTEDYRNLVMIEVMEYEMKKERTASIPSEWFAGGGQYMGKQQRAKYLGFLVDKEYYEQAFWWIEQYGTAYVSSYTILKILTALADTQEAEKELYYRLCYGAFRNGQMNYRSLKYLSETFLGTCVQMTEVWKQAKAFGVDTRELEERILTQMMFTETDLEEHFEIYLSYNERKPEESVRKAYLSYYSGKAFNGLSSPDSRFYFLLEEELFSGRGGNEICKLAYLKYLSCQHVLSVRQKNLAAAFLKEFFAKKTYYGFMQKFGSCIPEALILEDKVFVEYYAPQTSSVILHYVIENGEEQSGNYAASKLYPSYCGMHSASFSLLEGEHLVYFITEKDEDGQIHSTQPKILKKGKGIHQSGTKYERINAMRKLEREKNGDALQKSEEEFAFLEMASEKLFSIK